MEKNEVIERVNEYLNVAKERGNLYSLDKVGLWCVSKATQLPPYEYCGQIYHGSFLDVIAIAVQNKTFFARLGEMYVFGEIREAEIKELGRNFNPEDLEEKVRN